jgi:hypothetical protein
MTFSLASAATAQVDHPVITELYQEPPGLGGPVGRDPQDPHQEFIEIYIPPLADLALGLNKDSLKLTIYDVEGDSSSPALALVNYRIDLPAFDLDPSNGLTGLARPSSGVVVLGWVDYVGNPPTDLAGTPATRVALVNGGVTGTAGYTFIAINGSQFTGTTNFPVPDAISHLDTVSDPIIGKIEQGSSALLLVNRDDPGYAVLCGNTDPGPCNSFPNLPAGTTLGASSLLDGFAPNDDNSFDPLDQPYAAPTGDNIDLEFVLPLGGAFSLLVPQLEEEDGDGYQRFFTDLLKTTEDVVANDPVIDSLTAYGSIANIGPFAPSPGVAPATTSAASLSVADALLQQFQVLTDTSARPGVFAANVGGDFGVDTGTTPGASSTPAAMTVLPGASTFAPVGQVTIDPAVEVITFATTPAGHMETISVQVDATPAGMGDPSVSNPTAIVSATFTAINPTQGIDTLGMPFEATSFLAVQSLPDEPGVLNEFATTSLAQRLAVSLGVYDFDSRGTGALLTNPLTDLSDPLVVDPLVATMPTDPLEFINPVGTNATLVQKVLNSQLVATGSTTYDASFNVGQTLVQAREFDMPGIIGTPTSGSGFVPSERIHYADSKGLPGRPSSGFTDVLTARDFELVLIDTNLEVLGTIESGATDDFGLVVEVGSIGGGASVAVGDFVMLSFMGGLEGADIDTLSMPPTGNLPNLTNLIYVDLDPLDTVLGIKTVSRVFVVDGSGTGEVDLLDVIALPEPGVLPGLGCGIGLLVLLSRRARKTSAIRAGRLALPE